MKSMTSESITVTRRRFGFRGVTAAAAALALFVGVPRLSSQEPPQMPVPQKEHKWLEQFTGEWESEIEITMGPGGAVMKGKGTESARMVGGFWIVAESKSEMMGMPFSSVLTLGYDPAKKKYVGTWIDSMSSYLWNYVGSVDESGKILTLETNGPSPMAPDKISKFREVTEFKSKDHRVFTSSIQGDDGKWTTFVTVHSRRKK
jgi:hypothetical protein